MFDDKNIILRKNMRARFYKHIYFYTDILERNTVVSNRRTIH